MPSIGYDSGDDSGSDYEGESQPFLSEGDNLSVLQEKIDRNIKRAFMLIPGVSITFLGTITIGILLYLINLYTNDSIPLYLFCSLLWIGYSFICMILIKMYLRIRKSVNTYASFCSISSKQRPLDSRYQSILIVFTHMLWIASVLITTTIADVLVLLNHYDVVPAYAFTIPLFANLALSLAYAIITK